jgi:hypothetical protein
MRYYVGAWPNKGGAHELKSDPNLAIVVDQTVKRARRGTQHSPDSASAL